MMKRWYSILTVCLITPVTLLADAPTYEAVGVGNLTKIRRDDALDKAGEDAIRIESARNEWESFQVVVHSAESLKGVKVELSDLAGDAGTIPASAYRTFVEAYHQIKSPSVLAQTPLQEPASVVGQWWPDALLPYQPFEVLGGNQGVWIELRVPKDIAAGAYRGTVTITPENAPAKSIPVELTVWDFTLPDTPTFRQMGNVQPWGNVHTALPGTEEWKKQFKSRTMWFLDEGISSGWLISPKATPENWTPLQVWPWDEEYADYFNHPNCTVVEFPSDVPDWEHPEILHDLVEKVHERWGDKIATVTRTHDEPPADWYPTGKKHGMMVHAVHPELKVLLTAKDISPALMGGVDYWCPFYTEIGGRISLDLIRERIAKGEQVWFYANSNTFPIDIQSMQHRVPGWTAARFGLAGEYQFALNWWLTTDGYTDPWENILSATNQVNGGSWLAWPGESKGYDHLIGSIRLAQVREWMADYEYFAILKKRMNELADEFGIREELPWLADDRAYEIAGQVVTDVFRFNTSAENLFNVRRHLAREIIEVTQSPKVVFAMNPRAGDVTDVMQAMITGAAEKGTQVSVNGQAVTLDEHGHFKVEVPLVENENNVEIVASLNGKTKTFGRKVIYRPDDSVIRTIKSAIEEANTLGVEVPGRLNRLVAYYEEKKGWDAPRREDAQRQLDVLAQSRFTALRAKVKASSLPAKVKETLLTRADERLGTGETSAAGDLLREGLKIQSAGACQIIPVRYEDFFGWEMSNGDVRATVIEEGGRIIEMKANGVPLLMRGLVRALDLGEGTWRDMGGYGDVLNDRLDAELSQGRWALAIASATADAVSLRAERDYTDANGNKFHIARKMTLRKGSPTLAMDYEITNLTKASVEFAWRAHITPAVGENSQNSGGNPEKDAFILGKGATMKSDAFRYDAYASEPSGTHTDTVMRMPGGYIALYDADAKAALVLHGNAKVPYVYMWYDTSDTKPYENPWKATRNRYTVEPNTSLGSPAAPLKAGPGETVRFTMGLSGLHDVKDTDAVVAEAERLQKALQD